MNESIHGHEVLEMALSAAQPLTRESFEARVNARFGPDARFHTCSIEGLSCAELLDFLTRRGKLVLSNGALAADASKICKH